MSEEGKQSEFNSAVFAIERVDTIKKMCQEAKASKRYKPWLDYLFMYLAEVAPQMSEEEETEYFNRLRGVRKSIRVPKQADASLYEDDIYDQLFEVELALERFFDSMGNKFLYTKQRREISFSDEELKDLSKYGGGGEWAKVNKN